MVLCQARCTGGPRDGLNRVHVVSALSQKTPEPNQRAPPSSGPPTISRLDTILYYTMRIMKTTRRDRTMLLRTMRARAFVVEDWT